jgi:hypothetical protein
VLANSVPLVGVLFLGWDAFFIVLLYWAENLVIGSYNILKMVLAQPPSPTELKKLADERVEGYVNNPENALDRPLSPTELEELTNEKGKNPPHWASSSLYHAKKLLYIPFFAFHYGAFAAGHGFFVLMMFGKGDAGFGQIIQNDQVWPCFFVFIQLFFIVVKHVYLTIPTNMKYALVALFVSHGVSFVYNYLYRGEYKTARLDALMGQPYSRVVVMHIAIIAGGFLSMVLVSPISLLIALVILKTAIDIKLHLRQHRVKQADVSD